MNKLAGVWGWGGGLQASYNSTVPEVFRCSAKSTCVNLNACWWLQKTVLSFIVHHSLHSNHVNLDPLNGCSFYSCQSGVKLELFTKTRSGNLTASMCNLWQKQHASSIVCSYQRISMFGWLAWQCKLTRDESYSKKYYTKKKNVHEKLKQRHCCLNYIQSYLLICDAQSVATIQ